MKTIDIPTDDPLKMVWAVREKIYEETKDMSTDQWNAYVQEGVDEFEREMEKRRQMLPGDRPKHADL